MSKFIYGAFAAAILLLFVAIGIQRHQITSLTKDRDNWRDSARTYDAAWKAWAASYWESERIRGQERDQSVTAINEDAKACDARVASARASASAITKIITKETICEAGTSPQRRLVDPRELRDALTPAATGGAAKTQGR